MKFQEFREYFICPFCGSEISFLIDESYSDRYECWTGCTVCARLSKFVDSSQRCNECNFKLGCLGTPEPIVFAFRIDTENLRGDLRA